MFPMRNQPPHFRNDDQRYTGILFVTLCKGCSFSTLQEFSPSTEMHLKTHHTCTMELFTKIVQGLKTPC